MNEGLTAKEVPPVQSQIDALEVSIENLTEVLNNLEVRLRPVLGSSFEDKLEDLSSQEKDSYCELENSIYSARCEVEKNINKLIRIKESLCI